MRILFYVESLRAGGKERRIVELLKALTRFPDVTLGLVLTRDEIHYKEIFDLGIPIFFTKRKFLKKDPMLFLKFFGIAKRFNPDIIHVWGNMVAFYAVPTKRFLHVPMINNQITDTTFHAKVFGKSFAFNNSDLIIANTKLGLLAYDAPVEKSKVIYNGFNFDRLDQLPNVQHVRDKYAITTPYVVGMVASFTDFKDYKTYVQAAIAMAKQRQDITFLCVGDRDDSAYRMMVEEAQKPFVRFLGKQDAVEEIMNVCDVGVLLSNAPKHGEGISNALMEFMALSKPVIATNAGGSVELIQQNESGYLIQAFSTTELINKLTYLFANPEARERIGASARKRVLATFEISQMVNSFYKEYTTLLKK